MTEIDKPVYNDEEKRLTLVEHLEELRGRIIRSLAAIFISAIFTYNFREAILRFLLRPVGKVVFISPAEAFMVNIKVALISGAFISSPYVLFQIWRFISAGLRESERRYMIGFGFFSFGLFVCGSLFGYVIILPVAIKFLLGFGGELITPMISVNRYVSFASMLTFAFSIVFQVPLAMLFLTKTGLVRVDFLRTKRRHAIVAIFIISALLTPPDVFTQCLMAVPLILLYEIGLFLSGRTRAR